MTTKPMTIEEVKKRFRLLWGLAPSDSLKYNKGKDIESFIIATLKEFGEYVVGEDDNKYPSGLDPRSIAEEYRNVLRKQQRARIATFFDGKEVK